MMIIERIKSLFSFFDKSVLTDLERETLKRLKKKDTKISEEKNRKPSTYVQTSNRFFSNISLGLLSKEMFKDLPKNLIKANLDYLPKSYVSVIISTTILSILAAIFLFVFFLFFNIGVKLPIITFATGGFLSRFLSTFWILFFIPASTFLFMYTYPNMESGVVRRKINLELPFATIHMSAISGSLIDPTKIFSIIVSTKEYPYIEKEFVKLMNSINVLGHDLVSALRTSAINTSSKNLSEIFNGLATTIHSGGSLPKFFEERSNSLLFEYNLEKGKSTKLAETFMDIYISVVIAAPMILMLLLMMMKISGLGIPLSTSAITLIMVTGVSFINLVFLTFLHLKQPNV